MACCCYELHGDLRPAQEKCRLEAWRCEEDLQDAVAEARNIALASPDTL